MSADLQALLGSIPEGTDLFAHIEFMLEEGVFPILGGAFWSQVWLAIGLLATIIVCFTAGFVLRFMRRRTSFIVQDGSLTRPDQRTVVPLLWSLQAFLLIVLNGAFRHDMMKRSHTKFIGRFWLLMTCPLIVSYALVTSNIVASAPPVRKRFSNMQHGGLWFNALLAMLCLFLCAGVVPPSISLGQALWEGSEGYKAGIAIVRQAAAAQDITMLLDMEDVMALLDQAGKHNASATRNGNLVYAAYIFFFMASCIIPGLILARYVNKKISRLQDKQSSTAKSTSGDLWAKRTKRDIDLQTDIELSALPAPSGGLNRSRTTSHFPAQPKDRPFAGLVKVETPALPSRFNDILEDKRHTSEERALRLKRVLQSDMRFLAAYTLLLCAYAGMTVFESSKGQLILSARQDLELSLAFPTWNFVVPGLIVSFTFLYDALRYRDGEDGFSPTSRQPSPRFTAPAVSAIQCNQLVNVVYSEEVKDVEKMSSSEADEELQESLRH